MWQPQTQMPQICHRPSRASCTPLVLCDGALSVIHINYGLDVVLLDFVIAQQCITGGCRYHLLVQSTTSTGDELIGGSNYGCGKMSKAQFNSSEIDPPALAYYLCP